MGYVDGDLDPALNELADDGRLVVVVDQLEEVFSVCATEEERQGFIDQLTAAAQHAPARIAVVVLRADFYGECSASAHSHSSGVCELFVDRDLGWLSVDGVE
ncbi:MAG: hypothetical protein M3P18_03785 [Actinomycetota bacterium]|nr:hypothetical protein [Actinomycetota bacterium]